MGRQKKEFRRLTIEELRKYAGCEKLTDEQAKEAIEGIEKLSLIIIRNQLGIK